MSKNRNTCCSHVDIVVEYCETVETGQRHEKRIYKNILYLYKNKKKIKYI